MMPGMAMTQDNNIITAIQMHGQLIARHAVAVYSNTTSCPSLHNPLHMHQSPQHTPNLKEVAVPSIK